MASDGTQPWDGESRLSNPLDTVSLLEIGSTQANSQAFHLPEEHPVNALTDFQFRGLFTL